MTTATTEAKGWTPEQESQIAKLMETEGLSRPQAIRNMVTANKPKKGAAAPKAAKPAAQPKAVKTGKPKRKEAGDCHLSDEKKEQIGVLARKLIGTKASVEGIVRSSLNDKYGLYIWYGISDGRVVNVHPEKMTAKFKDADSWAVREWKKIWAKRLRCEEKKAKGLDKADTRALGKK